MSTDTPRRSFLQRFWIPLRLLALGVIIEIVIWTTNIVPELLVPQFGNSARVVVGRNFALLIAGFLLIWLLFTRQVSRKTKLISFASIIGIVGLGAASIREIENTGNNNFVFHFRWEPTQDQRLAEFHKTARPIVANSTLDASAPRFTDFLGPKRDGIVPGVKLSADFSKHPPKELWRRPVGGGYASCAIAGGLAVTIEQRAEEEVVVAYDFKTGDERWIRSYPGHFKERLGGNGPRATPTIADSEVFALGAGGILAALDLATGTEKWKTNILHDADAPNITWGMCGAPLVVGDKVIVNPGGSKDHGIVAYDRKTGKPLWHAGNTKAAYATPVLAIIAGQEMVLILDSAGVAGHHLASGTELWRHPFPTFNGINVAQPLALPDDRVFISAGYDAGSITLQIKKDGEKWSATPIWQNKRLKSKFSSAIYHEGYLYGMDDGIMACIDAKTGKRTWKAGRYGHSQILLRDKMIIIMGEAGDLILVAADPKAHRELARKPMLPGGKAWNAPALAGNMLLLRNHFEAVLLELTCE